MDDTLAIQEQVLDNLLCITNILSSRLADIENKKTISQHDAQEAMFMIRSMLEIRDALKEKPV